MSRISNQTSIHDKPTKHTLYPSNTTPKATSISLPPLLDTSLLLTAIANRAVSNHPQSSDHQQPILLASHVHAQQVNSLFAQESVMFTFARRLESIAAAEARREALVKECEGRKQCRASIRSAAATTTLFTGKRLRSPALGFFVFLLLKVTRCVCRPRRVESPNAERWPSGKSSSCYRCSDG